MYTSCTGQWCFRPRLRTHQTSAVIWNWWFQDIPRWYKVLKVMRQWWARCSCVVLAMGMLRPLQEINMAGKLLMVFLQSCAFTQSPKFPSRTRSWVMPSTASFVDFWFYFILFYSIPCLDQNHRPLGSEPQTSKWGWRLLRRDEDRRLNRS